MTCTFKGKTALVTGASGGIGRAIAVLLGQGGADVIVHYATGRDRAEETATLVRAASGTAKLIQADLRQSAGVREVADACGTRLDILVNNAGVARGHSLEHTEEGDFDTVFETNVRSVFFLTQALLPKMKAGASIVNISSMVSIVAYPSTISYAMSKAALNSFTRSLAADLGPRGIQVNAVAPGATDSEFLKSIRDNPEIMAGICAATAFGRLGTPEDIAHAVAFLASPDSGWITGQVLQASGGMHL